MNNELNKICTYSTTKYPFNKLISSVVSNFLGEKIEDLSKLHNYVNDKSLPALIHEIYQYFRDEDFLNCYSKFCTSHLKLHFDDKFKYQAVPSLRIQYPGSQSVNFHNDIMYGHGQDIINIWVPLVPVYDSKSMHVIDETNSISLNESFKNKKWSILELNKICRKKAKSLNMDYGQYFIFHTWVLHGTIENVIDETRVSFDTRILPNNGDYGLKDYSFFVNKSVIESNVEQKESAIYMHNFVGFTEKISTRYQSVLCQRYASNNNLIVLYEETEIRTVSHQPNLYDLCFGTYKGTLSSIIMISLLLLPDNKSKREDFLRKVHAEGISLHFVLDDLIFNKDESITRVMNAYSDLNGIDQN